MNASLGGKYNIDRRLNKVMSSDHLLGSALLLLLKGHAKWINSRRLLSLMAVTVVVVVVVVAVVAVVVVVVVVAVVVVVGVVVVVAMVVVVVVVAVGRWWRCI